MTLATSVAARQGPIAMAAHQICLQVWLAVSLLTDAFAASAQVNKNSLPVQHMEFVLTNHFCEERK